MKHTPARVIHQKVSVWYNRELKMMTIRSQTMTGITLGFASLIAGFFAHLALTDIYHGEMDTTLEWHVVQLAALIILLFIGFSLLTFARTLKTIKASE